jgi:hypothetical protein
MLLGIRSDAVHANMSCCWCAEPQHVAHLANFLFKALAAVVESALKAIRCCVLKAFLQVNNESGNATACRQEVVFCGGWLRE